jgi:uncharacterized membrane protein
MVQKTATIKTLEQVESTIRNQGIVSNNYIVNRLKKSYYSVDFAIKYLLSKGMIEEVKSSARDHLYRIKEGMTSHV